MRRLSVVALVTLMAIAGCTKPAAEVEPQAADGSVDDGVSVVARPTNAASSAANATAAEPLASATSPPALVPRRIAFGAPIELPLVDGVGGGEPNIAVLPDGTLFVTSPSGSQNKPNGLNGAAYLWRSTDGGASWESLREPTGSPIGFGPFCSCDADVVTSSDGWVYYSDWWLALAGGNYLVEASDDGGEIFSQAPVTTREALGGSVDRQWLVAGEGGFLGLFYSYFAPLNLGAVSSPIPDLASGIHAVFSNDHGATWGDPVTVVARSAGESLQIAHPRILPDGTIIMPYGVMTSEGADTVWRGESRIMMAASKDTGATWATSPVAEAPEGFDNLWAVQADVTTDGAIHVGWAARVSDDIMATYVATSRDGGQSWSAPLALRSEGLNFLPWVATFGNSTIALGWYGGDATGDPTEANAPWYAYVAESRDGGETFTVHRVSEEPAMDGGLCPRGASCTGDRELLDYVSLVYDSSGRLYYAFARSDSGIAQTLVASAPAQVSA